MADSPASRTFAELGLNEQILKALSDLGYEAPTPIQERTIPVLLGGKDLIGQAQTGTGKTAAFALPILEHLDPKIKATQALILAPTRELAMQVAEAFHTYSKHIGTVTVLPVYGGAPIVMQMKHLARGAQIVVGTPGRLIDHLDRQTLKLDAVSMVVLDEADEMLKMGFIEDVERILSAIPKPRQIALFSATMPAEVVRVAERHLVSPTRVEIERKEMTAPAIEQRFLNISEGQKLDVLTQILELEEADAVLIFRRTKNGAAELAEKLEARGFAAVAMHGDMNQTMRENVIRRLRLGQIEIVVATDVAARGLDVEQISHVVNYDVPHDVEAYVHRVGRTGRAGRTGMATLFVTPRERRMMRDIERYTGAPIKPMKMPTLSDVAARRMSVFKETLRKTITDGDLDLYVALVEQLAEEGPYDVTEVGAAAAKLATAGRTLAVSPQAAAAAEAAERRREAESAPRTSAGPRVPRPASDDEGPRVRLSMGVGKRDGIRPADIVGSIANEADVPGRDIGPIDIRDEVTYVTVPEKFVEAILAKVGRTKFRGRSVNLKVAGPGDAQYAPRGDSEETPRARRTYGADRAPSDRAPYGDKKPYAKKPYPTDKKPYVAGEKKPYSADKKPYSADKKPYASKSYGAAAEKKPYAKREGGYERAAAAPRGAAPRAAARPRTGPASSRTAPPRGRGAAPGRPPKGGGGRFSR